MLNVSTGIWPAVPSDSASLFGFGWGLYEQPRYPSVGTSLSSVLRARSDYRRESCNRLYKMSDAVSIRRLTMTEEEGHQKRGWEGRLCTYSGFYIFLAQHCIVMHCHSRMVDIQYRAQRFRTKMILTNELQPGKLSSTQVTVAIARLRS